MAPSKIPRTPTSVRFSATGKRLLEKLSEHLGITKAAVLELAIRQMAEKENIE